MYNADWNHFFALIISSRRIAGSSQVIILFASGQYVAVYPYQSVFGAIRMNISIFCGIRQ